MRLKNISQEEQKVFPHAGPSFAVAAGELTPELDEAVARDLLSIPSVWQVADTKPQSTKEI